MESESEKLSNNLVWLLICTMVLKETVISLLHPGYGEVCLILLTVNISEDVGIPAQDPPRTSKGSEFAAPHISAFTRFTGFDWKHMLLMLSKTSGAFCAHARLTKLNTTLLGVPSASALGGWNDRVPVVLFHWINLLSTDAPLMVTPDTVSVWVCTSPDIDILGVGKRLLISTPTLVLNVSVSVFCAPCHGELCVRSANSISDLTTRNGPLFAASVCFIVLLGITTPAWHPMSMFLARIHTGSAGCSHKGFVRLKLKE
jgi:hypothetical protein